MALTCNKALSGRAAGPADLASEASYEAGRLLALTRRKTPAKPNQATKNGLKAVFH